MINLSIIISFFYYTQLRVQECKTKKLCSYQNCLRQAFQTTRDASYPELISEGLTKTKHKEDVMPEDKLLQVITLVEQQEHLVPVLDLPV